MKNRLLCFSVLSLLLFSACGMNVTPEERDKSAAKNAAKAYYIELLSGQYDRFLMGRAGMDSIPASYREQLTDSYKQFMATMEEKHGGIRSFIVNNASIDSTQHLIQVFLVLNFGDATQEEIVVPMVNDQGVWKIK